MQIYTGDGKGKTTAALGLAIRAAGAGLKVYIGQFLKKGGYSELKALERFSDAITIEQFGDPLRGMDADPREPRGWLGAPECATGPVRPIALGGERPIVG